MQEIKMENQCKMEHVGGGEAVGEGKRLLTTRRKCYVSQVEEYGLTEWIRSRGRRNGVKTEPQAGQEKREEEQRRQGEEGEAKIKALILEKIQNLENKVLYPSCMGPHPIYVSDHGQQASNRTRVVNLKVALRQWLRIFFRTPAKGLILSPTLKPKPTPSQNTPFTKVNKYNKYNLAFKQRIISKIQQQMAQPKAKSLRYYICLQAKQLGIHPKNITRWFAAGDLERRQGGRRARYPILEYLLCKFMEEHPRAKRREIMAEAKHILDRLGEAENFSFSKGWYERFRVRMRQRKVENSMKMILCDENADYRRQLMALLQQQNTQGAGQQVKQEIKQDIHNDESVQSDSFTLHCYDTTPLSIPMPSSDFPDVKQEHSSDTP